MQAYFPIQTKFEGIVTNAEQGTDVIFSAIIAGILLYFINNSFLNNFPAYVTILAGFILTTYLGSYSIIKDLGFVLLTDGIFKLIKQYITVSS
jgi:hypothetical protein